MMKLLQFPWISLDMFGKHLKSLGINLMDEGFPRTQLNFSLDLAWEGLLGFSLRAAAGARLRGLFCKPMASLLSSRHHRPHVEYMTHDIYPDH